LLGARGAGAAARECSGCSDGGSSAAGNSGGSGRRH